jgi:uncharacterized protein (DUF433 family)
MGDVVSAFSVEQVERLTGLSSSQLRDWDAAGFFLPAYASKNRNSPYSRIYSFDDLVSLRTLSILKSEYKISLQNLRKVAEKLSEHAGRPWSELTLYVLKKEVHFKNPISGHIQVPLASVADDMRQKAASLKNRSSDQIGQFEQKRFVAHNALVVAGTRIPISSIKEFHEAGFSPEQIVSQYPSLTLEDVTKALSCDADLTHAA